MRKKPQLCCFNKLNKHRLGTKIFAQSWLRSSLILAQSRSNSGSIQVQFRLNPGPTQTQSRLNPSLTKEAHFGSWAYWPMSSEEPKLGLSFWVFILFLEQLYMNIFKVEQRWNSQSNSGKRQEWGCGGGERRLRERQREKDLWAWEASFSQTVNWPLLANFLWSAISVGEEFCCFNESFSELILMKLESYGLI